MSILSVDNISPIGSGTSVTVNSAATLVLTNANSTGVVTATTFSGSGASLTNLPAANLTGTLPAISGANLTGVLKNVVEDTSPQLGGDLASNSNDILMAANDRVVFGSDALRVKHTGSHADIENTTGNITIKNDSSSSTEQILIQAKGGEDSIKAIANGAVELYHDNSKKLQTTTNGFQMYGHLFSDDDNKIQLGNSQDLQIFHDGSDSFIKDTGTGALKVCSNLFRVNNAANDEAMIKAEENAGVTLSYDASTKFETMSTGARIQGGLLFNSDTAAANTLDDYEEGSWTATVSGTNSNMGTQSGRSFKYTKIGNVVHFTFDFFQTNNNMSVTNVTIGGLPFTTFPDNLISHVSIGTIQANGGQFQMKNYLNNSGQIVIIDMGTISNIRHFFGQGHYFTAS